MKYRKFGGHGIIDQRDLVRLVDHLRLQPRPQRHQKMYPDGLRQRGELLR